MATTSAQAPSLTAEQNANRDNPASPSYVAPVAAASPVMGMDALAGSTKPATIPHIPPATAYDGLQGALETHTDQFSTGLDERAKAAQATKDDSYKALIQALGTTPGQDTLTDEAYKSGGVDTADADLKDINNQILQEQESLRRKVDTIQGANAEGASQGAVNQAVQAAKDKSLSRQADLAVIQLSKQGKYDSAKAIADRAVAATTEQGTQRINLLQKIYDENKDLFTTAEQEQFQTAQDDRKRELDEKTYEQRAKYDQIIKQGDPLYQAQLAKALQDVQGAVTSGSPVLTQAPDGSDINATIAAIARGTKLSATTQANLGNIVGVINSVQTLARNNAAGTFPGISPANAILDVIPFQSSFRSPAGVQSRGFLEGINLKVQQWASGASLSKEQTDQVMKMVPTTSDTDQNVKTKLDNLVNFMQQQVKGSLATEGVEYDPATVSMFNHRSLGDILQ